MLLEVAGRKEDVNTQMLHEETEMTESSQIYDIIVK